MYLLLDNYDSFTYILHDYILQLGQKCVVYKNDEITVKQIKELHPSRIIISPGPETPVQAGICMDVIHEFHQTTPILGICLGHQALGMYFGADLVHASYPMHGKTSHVRHYGHPIFAGIESPFPVMRYHSLALSGLPDALLSIATSNDDHCIMAIMHAGYPSIGIQFHPESIGTPAGLQILRNWQNMYP
jgi:anthranilate synthase/aminodeoxychorismate synthase-like glutamine amidotransferase